MKFNEIWKNGGKDSGTEAIESYPILLVCRALDKHDQHKRVLLRTQCNRAQKCESLPTQSKALCKF